MRYTNNTIKEKKLPYYEIILCLKKYCTFRLIRSGGGQRPSFKSITFENILFRKINP